MLMSNALTWWQLLVSEPKRFSDKRGFFSETYNRSKWFDFGFKLDFVQDNHSLSREKGVVRGLHFQAPPHAQDKLVRVTRGSILDVAMDIRKGSPTFGRHIAVVLSAKNWRQLLVPKGFAHGFCTLERDSEVLYKVTEFYEPESEGGILWSDPSLGIDWPVASKDAVVSDKDAILPHLDDFVSPFDYDPNHPLEHFRLGGGS